jgi:flagellar hook-associated protein 1 FlgK
MQSYSIALSGLTAAYAALDTVGNNIANAATDGYHRQRVELTPSSNNQSAGTSAGGVDVVGITRIIDSLLEREIISQKSLYSCVSQQSSVLSSIETSLGEFSDEGGLNAAIDNFFDALRGLAANPSDNTCRNEVVSSAEAMTAEFRRLGQFLSGLDGQIILEAQQTVESINLLTQQIAELNGKIQETEINGDQANNLRDRRDHLISQLSELTSLETQEGDYGVVNVSISGLPVVAGSIAMDITVALQSDGSLGVAAAGSDVSSLDVDGGRLGGLLSLKNELLPEFRDELDALAQGLIDQINQYHAQGLGTNGAFTELTGWSMGGQSLTEAGVTDGSLYIRVTNTSTGEVERHRVDVDVSGSTPDTLSSIAAKIGAIDGLNASVVSSQLYIGADSGYTFDFVPAVLSEPVESSLSATSPPSISISGIYEGAENQTLTFTVVGSGSVGNGNLHLEVSSSEGEVIASLSIGSGYAAGDTIEMSNGVKISIGQGDLNEGDSFDVEAFATTDTSGLLVATGLNAFFSGSNASDMDVCSDISDHPSRIATALGSDLSDNAAILKLSGVHDEAIDSLDGMTVNEYYQRTVARLSQDVALQESRTENIDAMLQSLQKQQSDISGINVNDEAAQLLLFERMFQAVAKYLNSLQTSVNTLMDIL